MEELSVVQWFWGSLTTFVVIYNVFRIYDEKIMHKMHWIVSVPLFVLWVGSGVMAFTTGLQLLLNLA